MRYKHCNLEKIWMSLQGRHMNATAPQITGKLTFCSTVDSFFRLPTEETSNPASLVHCEGNPPTKGQHTESLFDVLSSSRHVTSLSSFLWQVRPLVWERKSCRMNLWRIALMHHPATIKKIVFFRTYVSHNDGLVQDCRISTANALEIHRSLALSHWYGSLTQTQTATNLTKWRLFQQSQRTHGAIITTLLRQNNSRRRFDVVMTSPLHRVSAGMP